MSGRKVSYLSTTQIQCINTTYIFEAVNLVFCAIRTSDDLLANGRFFLITRRFRFVDLQGYF